MDWLNSSMLLWLPVADGLAVVEDVGIAVGVAVAVWRLPLKLLLGWVLEDGLWTMDVAVADDVAVAVADNVAFAVAVATIVKRQE